MTAEVKPALTPEEWAAKRVSRDGYDQCAVVGCEVRFPKERKYERGKWFALCLGDGDDVLRPSTAHAVAALALHGQPFGFTREDVTKLRGLMLASLQDRTVFPDGRIAEWWHSLIARIEALLPPEDTQ